MVVMGVIAILALMTVPTYMEKAVREQVTEALPLADIAKAPTAAAWALALPLPADNEAAGLPASDKIVSNYVSSVSVQGGAIHIVFGNRASSVLKGELVSALLEHPASGAREIAQEPVPREPRDFIQRARLLEEMRRAGDDYELSLAAHLGERCAVQREDLEVVAADDEKRWRAHARQGVPCKIGPSAARHDRADRVWAFGGRDQRRCGPGAGAEVADAQR